MIIGYDQGYFHTYGSSQVHRAVGGIYFGGGVGAEFFITRRKFASYVSNFFETKYASFELGGRQKGTFYTRTTIFLSPKTDVDASDALRSDK